MLEKKVGSVEKKVDSLSSKESGPCARGKTMHFCDLKRGEKVISCLHFPFIRNN